MRFFNTKGVKYIEGMPQNVTTSIQRKLLDFRNNVFAKLANIRPRRITSRIVRYCDTHLLQPIYNKFGLYNPLGCSVYAKPLRSSSRNIYCSSFFENPRYFEDIRDTLLEEFQPRNEVMPQNAELFRNIQNSESVCVHIRRGDFLTPKIAEIFHVCTQEYFVQAMKAIRAEVPDCKFFVFSDDVDEVKRSMHLPFAVEYENANNPSYESLRLMYSCKHFIISNSTFSWWTQYLGRNPNKIVYIPSPWHWRGETWKDLYLPYMRIIKCNKRV